MGLMSPHDLNDNPRRWLDTPHEVHESLSGLMEKLYPGFAQRLTEAKVHCLLCEYREPFEVIIIATGNPATCDGYIGDLDNVELLHTTNLEEEVKL